MKPVPILFFIHSLGHGGSERQLATIAGGLDRSRFEPHIGTVTGGFRVDHLRANGLQIFTLPLHSYTSPHTLSLIWRMRNYVREHGIRIVHPFDYSLLLFGGLTARAAGVCGLSSQRFLMDTVPAKYQPLVRAGHRLAHGIVANSQAAAEQLRTEYHYPASKIEVCWNGIDTEQFSPEPRRRLEPVKDAELVVGTVCVLRPEKNLTHLVDSFQRVCAKRACVKLLIVGSGPEEPSLREAVERAGIGSQTCFLPSTPDVATALRSIDIFVHPSRSEGLPNGVMEAMACGCTVVATRVGGCPELIDSGVEGILTIPGDLNDLSAALQSVVDQPSLRQRLSDAAAARIRSRFSVETSVRRMEEIYDRFLNRR